MTRRHFIALADAIRDIIRDINRHRLVLLEENLISVLELKNLNSTARHILNNALVIVQRMLEQEVKQ